MRRLRNDKGAVAVIVALMMVVLMTFAALVIDVGASYLARRQLQNAADASALAVAQDCGNGTCGDYAATATSLTVANSPGLAVTAGATIGKDPVTGKPYVTVTASSVVNYLFAPVIGIHNGTVTAQATASWGAPTGGQSMLPLAISWCSFFQQTNGLLPTGATPVTINTSKGDGTTCTGPSGNVVPGGFGWLKVDNGTNCKVTSSINHVVYSDPGAQSPCSDTLFDGQLTKSRTVLLPIFDDFGGTGTNAWYHVYGYAAFRITSHNFHGSDNSITGYFTVFVSSPDGFTYGTGSPDLGGRIVALTG